MKGDLKVMKISRRNFIKRATAVCLSSCMALAGFTGCSGGSSSSAAADTVVYGKIYTSNANRDYAEAFAVKDGKYVYVGDEEGVKSYIKEGTTKVIDYRDKGLVMAGATEGHGHYMTASAMTYKNLIHVTSTIDETVEFMKGYIAEHPDDKMYLSYGWDNVKLAEIKKETDMRSKLDEICPDKIVIMIDNSGHNIFMNSKAIEAAGIDGNTVIEGGEFSKDTNGKLMGLATDIAMNYVVGKVIRDSGYLTPDDIAGAASLAEDQLHSYGYTNYFDAYISYFGETAYEGLAKLDKDKGLTVVVGGSYKIDPFEDENALIDRVVEYKDKWTTDRFKPGWIKLFSDGEATESMSGWVKTPYKTGKTGTQVWETERFNNLVKKANEKGVSVHVHASGDGATEQAVNAFINAEDTAASGILNGIGHARHITEETLDKMAEHGIFSATNINWRGLTIPKEGIKVEDYFDPTFYWQGYPMKSLVSRGIKMTSSTDYPASSGAPCDILNILELAVNDSMDSKYIPEGNEMGTFDKSEELTVEEALDVLTINGAYQMGIDKERGSIEVGKFADFLLISKDLTSIPKNEIHTAEISNVYFEGQEVYTKS